MGIGLRLVPKAINDTQSQGECGLTGFGGGPDSDRHISPQLFNDAIRLAVSYKQNSQDFMDEVLQELEVNLVEVGRGTATASG